MVNTVSGNNIELAINNLNDNTILLLTRLNDCFDFLLAFFISLLIVYVAYKMISFFIF